jgi:ribosomal protein L29
MCMVSNVGDGWAGQFPKKWPMFDPSPEGIDLTPIYSKSELYELKKEVKELRKLLIAARKFDKKTGQPDCEMADKVNLIKEIARLVGVDMKDVFGKESKAKP